MANGKTKKRDNQAIADAFASVSNLTGSMMHELYKHDQWLAEAFDAWKEVQNELADYIMYGEIHAEAAFVPETAVQVSKPSNIVKNLDKEHEPRIGTYFIIAPFMERHGYSAAGGWWVRRTI